MIDVSDIILKMRSRLNDKDVEKYRWSDEELIDCINSSIIEIQSETKDNTQTMCIKTEKNKTRYKLPKNLVEDNALTLDGVALAKKSLKWFEENKTEEQEFTYFYFDKKSLNIVSPFEIEDGMKIELSYEDIEQVESKEEEIDMHILLRDALLFYSLFLAYQVPTSDKNLKQEQKYQGLFQLQMSNKLPKIMKNKHSKKLRSKFKKV